MSEDFIMAPPSLRFATGEAKVELADAEISHEAATEDVEETQIATAIAPTAEPERELSIEEIFLAIHAIKAKKLKQDSIGSYGDITALQERNKLYQNLNAIIIAATDDKDHTINFDKMPPEFQALLDQARDLGIELPEMKGQFSSDQRIKLIDNIKDRMTSTNTEINLATQRSSQLIYELQEVYQWARSHQKTLDDAKKKILSNTGAR